MHTIDSLTSLGVAQRSQSHAQRTDKDAIVTLARTLAARLKCSVDTCVITDNSVPICVSLLLNCLRFEYKRNIEIEESKMHGLRMANCTLALFKHQFIHFETF